MADEIDDVAVYAPGRTSGLVFLGIAGLALLAGASALLAAVVSGQALLFTLTCSLFWLAFWLSFAYGEALLVADSLATDGKVLEWSGLRRRGTWSLEELATIRRGWINRSYISVENTAGKRILVRPQKGWGEFLAVIAPGRESDRASRPTWWERGLGSQSAFGWRKDWPRR